MTDITRMDWKAQNSRVRVECPRMYTFFSRDPADMQRLYCIDYNTNDNPLSPTYALPEHWLERVSLSDEQQL
jgi:hypothetical protein